MSRKFPAKRTAPAVRYCVSGESPEPDWPARTTASVFSCTRTSRVEDQRGLLDGLREIEPRGFHPRFDDMPGGGTRRAKLKKTILHQVPLFGDRLQLLGEPGLITGGCCCGLIVPATDLGIPAL